MNSLEVVSFPGLNQLGSLTAVWGHIPWNLYENNRTVLYFFAYDAAPKLSNHPKAVFSKIKMKKLSIEPFQ